MSSDASAPKGVRGYIVELAPGVWASGRDFRTTVRDGATFFYSARRARQALAAHQRTRPWPEARVVDVVVRLMPVSAETRSDREIEQMFDSATRERARLAAEEEAQRCADLRERDRARAERDRLQTAHRTVNLNARIRFTLAEPGVAPLAQRRAQERSFSAKVGIPAAPPWGVEPAAGDVVEMQLWRAWSIFGPALAVGFTPAFVDNTFTIIDEVSDG